MSVINKLRLRLTFPKTEKRSDDSGNSLPFHLTMFVFTAGSSELFALIDYFTVISITINVEL